MVVGLDPPFTKGGRFKPSRHYHAWGHPFSPCNPVMEVIHSCVQSKDRAAFDRNFLLERWCPHYDNSNISLPLLS